MDSKIKIIDNSSGDILYEYDAAEVDEAYTMASRMEEMGLDIVVKKQTIKDILSDSLEVDRIDIDDSCCHSFHDQTVDIIKDVSKKN